MDSKITEGEIEIALDGEKKYLIPSAQAAIDVSRYFGGFREAVSRVMAMEFEAIVYVVRSGLGIEADSSEAKELPEAVYRSSVQDLLAPLVRYLGCLSNGGKPIRENKGKTKNAKAEAKKP